MKSIANRHFPRFICNGNESVLFNPILKKRFKNRPEERVRLKWVEYLAYQTDWPKSRIGFEAPVTLHQAKNALRADLILYNRNMSPEILIECKAESVRLNSTVAEQAARYNQAVGAPYICLTNGVSDFWYRVEDGTVTEFKPNTTPDFPFKETRPISEIHRDYDYWSKRGFCAGQFSDSNEEILQKSITHFWSDSIDWQMNYLNFSSSPFSFGLQQYYRIPVIDNEQKLAISFIGTPAETTNLVAILNIKGENHAVLSINLNQLSEGHTDSARLFHAGEVQTRNTGKLLPFFENRFSSKRIEQLPHYLMRFFD